MRLSELDPRMKESKVDGEAVILFDCPKCGGTVHQVRVVISAEAYHERDPVAGEHSDKKVKVWQASGHFPDAFTLVPSVNIVKKDGAGNWITDCWHGFITNGEVT